MARKILQHRQRLLLPAFGVALAEASSTARLVRLRLEGEAAAQGSDLVEGSGAADCPPRQGARSEERRVGKSVSVRVDRGGRRSIKQKTKKSQRQRHDTVHRARQGKQVADSRNIK